MKRISLEKMEAMLSGIRQAELILVWISTTITRNRRGSYGDFSD